MTQDQKNALIAARYALVTSGNLTATDVPKWVGGHLFVPKDHTWSTDNSRAISALDKAFPDLAPPVIRAPLNV